MYICTYPFIFFRKITPYLSAGRLHENNTISRIARNLRWLEGVYR